MKRIINGKRYDTSTAEQVGEYCNGFRLHDWHWLEEKLYRTPKGAYFLHGEGGGLSEYRSGARGTGWTNGQALIPMTDDEAMRWLEEHGLTDAVEEHFADAFDDA